MMSTPAIQSGPLRQWQSFDTLAVPVFRLCVKRSGECLGLNDAG